MNGINYDLKSKLAELKEEGLGYLYSWGDVLWEFGSSERKQAFPFASGGDNCALAIEPISRYRAFRLGVPWLHVGNIKITSAKKAERANNITNGKAIFFHVPLPEKFSALREIYNNPFLLYNKIRGKITGPDLVIVGEYRTTSALAKEVLGGSEAFLKSLEKLFDYKKSYVEPNYSKQKIWILYDPTREPKLQVREYK